MRQTPFFPCTEFREHCLALILCPQTKSLCAQHQQQQKSCTCLHRHTVPELQSCKAFSSAAPRAVSRWHGLPCAKSEPCFLTGSKTPNFLEPCPIGRVPGTLLTCHRNFALMLGSHVLLAVSSPSLRRGSQAQALFDIVPLGFSARISNAARRMASPRIMPWDPSSDEGCVLNRDATMPQAHVK